ncbi:MAG: hypothetical protein ABIX10_06865 [Acidimicrobiales bacterium]
MAPHASPTGGCCGPDFASAHFVGVLVVWVALDSQVRSGPAALIEELSSAAQDGQPNLRRDELEICFCSDRPGSLGNDIYAAIRASSADAWSMPVNLGPAVNAEASETRPSLSWDGTTLYFGSNRAGGEGDTDHYVTTCLAHAG